MFTSTMSAPMLSTTCAAAAIFSGLPPKIWIETGRSSSVYSAYSSVRSIPRTSPSELTISLTTSPQPPRRFTSRRKAVSVMPAIGASANGCDSVILPIFIVRSVRLHIGRIDFDADRLADEVHREHEARMRPLADQPAHHSLERTVRHFDHHPFADQRTGIELEIAVDQPPDSLDFVLRDRHDVAVERDDAYDTGALENRKTLRTGEARKAVPGKKRPVDLLLPILPSAPARDRRQERFEPLAFELIADDLLVPRARPDGVPRRGILHSVERPSVCRRPAAGCRPTDRCRRRRRRSASRRPSSDPRSSTR